MLCLRTKETAGWVMAESGVGAGGGRGCWGSRAQDVSGYIIISRSNKVPRGQFCNNIATLTTFLLEVIELDQVSDIHCRDISNCFVFGLQKFPEI